MNVIMWLEKGLSLCIDYKTRPVSNMFLKDRLCVFILKIKIFKLPYRFQKQPLYKFACYQIQ